MTFVIAAVTVLKTVSVVDRSSSYETPTRIKLAASEEPNVYVEDVAPPMFEHVETVVDVHLCH